jgi:uncharacterized protein
VGCRRKAPADELVRVVRRPDGTLAVGRALPGRGAWLCAGSPGCAERAERRRAFDRALRTTVAPMAVAALRDLLAGHDDEGAPAPDGMPVEGGERGRLV